MCSFHGLKFFYWVILFALLILLSALGEYWIGCVEEKRVGAGGFFGCCCSSRRDLRLNLGGWKASRFVRALCLNAKTHKFLRSILMIFVGR